MPSDGRPFSSLHGLSNDEIGSDALEADISKALWRRNCNRTLPETHQCRVILVDPVALARNGSGCILERDRQADEVAAL